MSARWILGDKLLVAVVVSAALASSARAEPSSAQAEILFRQGKELMAHGRFAEACAAFDASQKIDPALTTLLNQAACREKNGQLATAWGLFVDAARQTRTATDDAGRQAQRTAREHAAKLEPRLSTLTIAVHPDNRIGGLEILRDGELVEPGAWNHALPVDGGTYKITARAPGNTAWSSTVTVAPERDAQSIETPRLHAALLEPRSERPPPGSGTAPTAATASARKPAGAASRPADRPRSRVIPFALGGAALALGGAAVGFELWSASVYDRAQREPDNARQDALWQSANTRRYLAEGLGVASVACVGVVVWWYLRGEREPAAAPGAALGLAPLVGADRAGLVLTGRY